MPDRAVAVLNMEKQVGSIKNRERLFIAGWQQRRRRVARASALLADARLWIVFATENIGLFVRRVARHGDLGMATALLQRHDSLRAQRQT